MTNSLIKLGTLSPSSFLHAPLTKLGALFSVTRRSRSDSVSESLSESVTLRTELTDVTLVSEDTYCRVYQ